MTIGDDLPVAIRAKARHRSSVIPGRRRFFTYDGRFADGRLAREVDVDAVLQGGRLPADAWAMREAAERACPDVGQGDWVEYPTGRPVHDSSGP